MSEASTNEPAFKLLAMFHPTVYVLDLDETEEWYRKVFGVPSTRLSTAPQDPDNRMDYSTFTMIRDVLIDSLDPKRFIRDGKQQYEDVDEPHLKTTGWYVEGVPALYHALRRAGISVRGRFGDDLTSDDAPAELQSDPAMFFTVADEIGLRYQFFAPMPLGFDPRTTDGWELGPRRGDDPLGIEFTSHHTLLTDRPERVRRLFVDVLGGRVIHEGRNEALGAQSTYVRLSDGAWEVAVPDEGTPAHADWQAAPNDCLHSITFKVGDLETARGHLESVDVGFRADTGSFVVTDPKTSQGIPWGFTADAIPGDDHA